MRVIHVRLSAIELTARILAARWVTYHGNALMPLSWVSWQCILLDLPIPSGRMAELERETVRQVLRAQNLVSFIELGNELLPPCETN